MSAQGTLQGAISIPNAVGPLVVTADLRAGVVTCHVEIAAPRDGRATTRVNWLLRQLRHAPDSTRIEAFVMHGRGAGTAELLHAVRDQPAVLIEDPKKELRSFRIALASPLGSKRGRGRGSFIDSVENAIDTFYGDIVQDLRAWSAAPPRLRETPEQPDERPSLTSTALSSQDGAGPDAPASQPDDARVLVPTADRRETDPEPAEQLSPSLVPGQPDAPEMSI